MRSFLALFLFLFLVTPAAVVFAHTQTGSLGTAADSTDHYIVYCSDDGDGPTSSLVMQVSSDSAGGPTVAVVGSIGNLATNSSDTVSGDGTPGPLTWVNGGDGDYDVSIVKAQSGGANYTLTYHCMTGINGGGLHTGTDIIFQQKGGTPGTPPAGLALTHTQNGSLSAPSTTTDFYNATCSDDGHGTPQSLVFQVQSTGPQAAPVLALVQSGVAAISSTDIVAGDGNYSPMDSVNGGAGVYNVLVITSGDGGSNYTLKYDCMTGTNGGGVATGATLVPVGAPVSGPVPAIEYYDAGFDHYFITRNPDEIALLDNGTIVGWARTGQSFNVYATAAPGANSVCRFFSTAFDPKSSHFYTPFADECATVMANPVWQFEGQGDQVFYIPVASDTGSCATGTIPVYRIYNNGMGGAPNHRYTASAATRDQMVSDGWVLEGNGPGFAFMCSPM
jgi:hypothetical protein